MERSILVQNIMNWAIVFAMVCLILFVFMYKYKTTSETCRVQLNTCEQSQI